MGAATLSFLFNGERVVVLLYLSRVFFSVPSPLLFEALALFLLSFAALFVEISAEGSQSLRRFKTRLGASSGIFLGAVTLPTVFLSRLIQMSRAFSLYVVNHEEMRYLNMQYWGVVICCFSVLLFLLCIRWQCGYDENVSGSWIDRYPKLPALVVVSFAIILISLGKYNSEKLLWICYHGLASVQLIQYIIHSFPECASIGEALLVTGGLVLYFGDFLVFTASKSVALVLPSKLSSFHFAIARSEISTFIQGILFGLLLLPLSYKFVLLVGICFTKKTIDNAETTTGMSSRGIGQSAVFYVSFALILLNASMWMQFVKDFSVHPLIWVFNFVFEDPLKRLALCMYWIFVICASVLKFYNISKHSKIERILLRKYYHLVAVLMFVPAFLFQPEFLGLSFGAAMAVFLVLEMIRVWKIWPLGWHVHKFMNAFTDHHDSDILIVSEIYMFMLLHCNHFSLLLGCALPKWMSSGFNDRPLAPFAGILSLGIGDTMASMVGHKYGVLRWSKTGKKTIEGTAAGIMSVLIACSTLVPLLASTGFIISEHWLSLLIAVTISGLLEAYTAQLDNAFIPLAFYTLLCL